MGSSTFMSIAATFLIVFVLLPGNDCSSEEDTLINKLLSNYQKLGRPGKKDQTTIIDYNLALNEIVDYDADSRKITLEVWEIVQWKDDRLSWNETEAGGIKSLRLSPAVIWTPDITPYNGWTEKSELLSIVVTSSGFMMWVPRRYIRYPCSLNETTVTLSCSLLMGSWSYDSSLLDLRMVGDHANLDSYYPNRRYKLIAAPAKYSFIKYECCPEKFAFIQYGIEIGFN